MPNILLRFVTQDTPIAHMIRTLTDFPFSHVEFVLDDDWPANAQKMTLGAHLDGGVALRPLDYAVFTREEWASVECTAEQKHAVVTDAMGCVGDGYDVRDIAGILFRQNWSTHGHHICSVFCAEKLINNGICLLRVTDNMPSITPRDLYMSPLLVKVAH